MDKKIGLTLLIIVIFTTIISFGTLLLSNEKTSTVADVVLQVDAEYAYYKFTFPNGTYVTYDYTNNTNYNLTLYTGTTYLFNITNTDGLGHAMAFRDQINTGNTPYQFDIPALTTNSSYYDYVNFTTASWYKVTCASSFGNYCGPNHGSMNFYVNVVDNPNSSPGGTVTVTNFVPVTSTTTQTSNVTQPVNVTVQSVQTLITTVTQSLPGMTVLFTFIALASLTPIYKLRKRQK